ncbi:MAG: acyl carrier protein [Rickettsiales bacterium]|nr:acyl carrier protein [Rickettsiales bacterium]
MTSTEFTAIVKVIIDQLEKVNDEKLPLSADTDITTDLHADSLAIMELVFALEDRFDVSIPLNELADLRTIGQIAALVNLKCTGNTA